MIRVSFIKIPYNKRTDTVDTWAWTAVVCVNNKAFAWYFPHSFCEGYGNAKIRVPVTDELFLDLALHWTLDCTCVLQTRRDRLDYGRRVIMGFGTSLIRARGRATRALLSPRASIVRRGLLYSMDTHTYHMMCSPDKAWNMLSPGQVRFSRRIVFASAIKTGNNENCNYT